MSRANTRHQHAVDRIADWIIGGRFNAVEPLPTEAQFGEELGVSRTVVREAMRTLVAKGIVSVRPRHGTRLQPQEAWHLFDPQVIAWRLRAGISPKFAADLIAFRLAIEPSAAAIAAERDDFPVDALEEAYRRMLAGVEGDGSYHEADLVFHQTILIGSKNQFLQHLVPFVGNLLRLSFNLSVLNMDSARASLPMHRAVADAIIAHDPRAARRELTALIESAGDDIFTTIQNNVSQNNAGRSTADAHADRPDFSPA